jgi:UTP-glucose-1-phosphate uridylyltransferase
MGPKLYIFNLLEKTMKPDKETFEAIIADLELTLSDEKKMFSNQNPKAYDLGWETGFEAAINQIKRRKKLFIGD